MLDPEIAFNALATFGAILVGALLVVILLAMIVAGIYLKDRWELEVRLDEMKKTATLIAGGTEESR